MINLLHFFGLLNLNHYTKKNNLIYLTVNEIKFYFFIDLMISSQIFQTISDIAILAKRYNYFIFDCDGVLVNHFRIILRNNETSGLKIEQ